MVTRLIKKLQHPPQLPQLQIRARSQEAKKPRAIRSITDQYEPKNSNDHTNPYYHWWPTNDKWEYLQYDFDQLETISSSGVYWFDDGPRGGCRIPSQWELQYKTGSGWKTIVPEDGYIIKKDAWNKVSFAPVSTRAIRLRVLLSEEFSSGVHEWVVK